MGCPPRSLAILDVGHGSCTVLVDSEGVVVVDAGPRSYLLEYLAELGVESVDVVLLSHADRDHIEGLVQLLASKRFRVGCVRLNSDALKGSDIWDDLAYELYKADNADELDFEPSLTKHGSGEFDRGEVHIEILAPSKYLATLGPGSTDRKGRALASNSISAVVRLETKDGKPIVLLPGDIDDVGVRNLVESGVCAKAPVLVFPHHGGKVGTEKVDEFVRLLCEAVSPRTVVFSTGRAQRPATPRREIVSALNRESREARILCTQLSQNCAKDVPTQRPPYVGRAFSAGKERGECCAGTILISVDDGSLLHPANSEHSGFLDGSVPGALCRSWNEGDAGLGDVAS